MLEALDITEAEARGLSELAELDLAMARSFAARAQAAEDPQVANSLARSYQRATRSYRQSLALKVRLKRELSRDLREGPTEPAPEPEPPTPARDAARIAERKAELKGPVRRVIWSEYEDCEHEDTLRDLFAELDELLTDPENTFGLVARDGAWQVQPLDDHLVEVCRELELPEAAARLWRDLPDPPATAPDPSGDQVVWRSSG